MSTANTDQAEFWTDQAGPTWVAQMDAMDAALAPVLTAVLARAAVSEGDHVLDVGCGAGTSTFAAAALAGANGHVCGVDISQTLLDAAETRNTGARPARFLLADAQSHGFAPDQFDLLMSRFGVMFFEDSVAAFANMARALKPGGRMAFATWGAIPENPYFTLPARIAKDLLGPVPKSDPDAPGPFAFREIPRVLDILEQAGFDKINGEATSMLLTPPGSTQEVADLMCEIGPAQRALSFFEADATDRAKLTEALAQALAPYQTTDGIRLPAVINLFEARKP
ncbi:MAG: class I SAM-dependent methyltransferase [Sulfitobacter sp.]